MTYVVLVVVMLALFTDCRPRCKTHPVAWVSWSLAIVATLAAMIALEAIDRGYSL